MRISTFLTVGDDNTPRVVRRARGGRDVFRFCERNDFGVWMLYGSAPRSCELQRCTDVRRERTPFPLLPPPAVYTAITVLFRLVSRIHTTLTRRRVRTGWFFRPFFSSRFYSDVVAVSREIDSAIIRDRISTRKYYFCSSFCIRDFRSALILFSTRTTNNVIRLWKPW